MVIGVGIDIIEIDRVRHVFEGRGGKSLAKVFTKKELEYAGRFDNPFTQLAARFSAKEAYYKAAGDGDIHFSEIEVENMPNGKPFINLYGHTLEQWKHMGSPDIHLSLTHNDLMGCAVVVLDRDVK